MTAFNDPTNPTPEITARNLGQSYLEEKNYAEAVSWFQTSVPRNAKPTPIAYLGLGDTYVAIGRLDDAIRELEVATKALPNDPLLTSPSGRLLPGGSLRRGAAALERVDAKDPQGPRAVVPSTSSGRFPK